MSEKKTIKEIVIEKNQGKIELNDFAFGLVKNPQDGLWTLVEIPYNIQMGEVGKIKIVAAEPDRSTMIERFKIEVSNRDIVG